MALERQIICTFANSWYFLLNSIVFNCDDQKHPVLQRIGTPHGEIGFQFLEISDSIEIQIMFLRENACRAGILPAKFQNNYLKPYICQILIQIAGRDDQNTTCQYIEHVSEKYPIDRPMAG